MFISPDSRTLHQPVQLADSRYQSAPVAALRSRCRRPFSKGAASVGFYCEVQQSARLSPCTLDILNMHGVSFL